MAMTGLLASVKTMIGFLGKQSPYLVEGHITVVISIVAVLTLTYVILIPIILGVLGVFLFLLIVFVFATRTGLKIALFGGHKEGPDKCGNSQIKHDEPTTLSGKWACSSEQLPSQGQGLGTIHSLSNDFKVFEKEELVAATENFHDNNHLGQGAFGAVYKGTTSQGSEIAVKKLSKNSKQGKDEFVNEIRLVAKVRHRNLVKLLGCCAEGSERLIVYEYLPNNSLYTFLFDPNKRSHLDWEKRYSIILGVSRGLLYLHEDSPLRIIHRDIKAGNILLDTKFNPKIADFGIARLLEEDESHVRTRPAGTRGYWAPEHAMEGHLSVKADVYSFGILLLELISGRKSIDFTLEDEMQVLSDWARGLNRGGNLVRLIDPVINETCGEKKEQVLRCIHVGLSCIQVEASLRPPMSIINVMLSTQFMNSTHPTQPNIETCRPNLDTKSTVICGPSQEYAQNDPLVTLSASVSSASAHIHKSSPSSASTTQSSSHTPLLPQCDAAALNTHRVPSTTGPEKSKFWKGKFWGAKFWNSKKAKTLHSGVNQSEQSILTNVFRVFELKTLLVATNNFHDNNKIGEGGFGPVYKGISPEGREIAVKNLCCTSRQGQEEFLVEIGMLAKIRHRNLVKLLGCCPAGSKSLLVYEYLSNNSLDKILFDPNKRRQLDWQKRYNIIVGVARGLLYLHEGALIIHRDIKASNVLLDVNMNPKIGDFGLAKQFDEDETHMSTRVAGTLGYLAPEYAMHGQLTIKADVYSFGVLLLELMSGRKNLVCNGIESHIHITDWAWRLYKEGNIVDMIDPVIIETCSDLKGQAFNNCIHIGLMCIQADASLRPSMSAINLMFSTELMNRELSIPAFVSHTSSSVFSSSDSSI